MNDVLKPIEAARLLRKGKNSIYALARSRKIPAQRIGRTFRFSRAALMEWLEKGGAR